MSTTRGTRRQLRAVIGGRPSSYLSDIVLALVLASLVAWYLDFKIRKPDLLRVELPETIGVPEGMTGVELMADGGPRVVTFAIDAPKEVLDRLQDRRLAYDFRISQADAERALGGDGTIEHDISLDHVVGLPVHVRERSEAGYPQPDRLTIHAVAVSIFEASRFELEGTVPVAAGLEYVGWTPPTAAVRIKVLRLAQPPAPGAGTLRIVASSHPPFLAGFQGALPLSRFTCVFRLDGREYPAVVLDDQASLDLEIRAERVTLVQRVQLEICPPDGVVVAEAPEQVELRFRVPASRAEELRSVLRTAATQGKPFPLVATVHFPWGEVPEGLTKLVRDRDWEYPNPDLPVTVFRVPPGIELDGLERAEWIRLEHMPR